MKTIQFARHHGLDGFFAAARGIVVVVVFVISVIGGEGGSTVGSVRVSWGGCGVSRRFGG